MNAPVPLRIDAVVDDAERPALVAATEQLRECLHAGSGSAWPVAVRFLDALAAIAARDRPTIVVASLLPELARDSEPLAATEARWREQLSRLVDMGVPAILVCTVFRHVAAPGSDRRPDSRPATRERIRRLNLLAIELSHDTGVGIVDVDRVFAHLGARELATDHRLSGRVAAEVAAASIVASIVGHGLDDIVSPQVQEHAQKFQGTLWDIGRLVDRRLAQRG